MGWRAGKHLYAGVNLSPQSGIYEFGYRVSKEEMGREEGGEALKRINKEKK
jgi:hypothetical protein